MSNSGAYTSVPLDFSSPRALIRQEEPKNKVRNHLHSSLGAFLEPLKLTSCRFSVQPFWVRL